MLRPAYHRHGDVAYEDCALQVFIEVGVVERSSHLLRRRPFINHGQHPEPLVPDSFAIGGYLSAAGFPGAAVDDNGKTVCRGLLRRGGSPSGGPRCRHERHQDAQFI